MNRKSQNWYIAIFMLVAFGLVQASIQYVSLAEDCENGIDDNGDGLIDCFDPLCSCIEPCVSEHYFYPCEDECEIRPECDQFSATLKWESNSNVGSYPVLVAGDIDRDGMPELVTYELESSRLIIMSGDDGVAERFINAPAILKGGMGPALADLDNDGFGEIIIVTNNRDLVAYRHTGALYFENPGVVGYDAGYEFAVVGVADFDQDGLPEIYVGNQIFDNTGQLIAQGGQNNAQGVHPELKGSNAFNAVVAVDAIPTSACPDCDGLELVAGNQIYTVDLANGNMTVYREVNGFSDGYTSVADFNKDGMLDAIVQGMDNGRKVVYGWDLNTGNVLGSFYFTTSLSNGASRVNIGDLDGDGSLDFCFSAHPNFYAVNAQFNEMWRLPINDGSSVTASTIFDFCGNGEAKILYRDEVALRIIDGSNGDELWTYPCTSNTFIENPLVLDIDADDQTDICVVCGPMFSRGRVYTLSPAGSNWAKSRRVWNQHSFFNVNVNDDLSIPRIQQNPHVVFDSLTLNGFMNQYASYDFRAVDLTWESPTIRCKNDSLRISFTICNEGGLATATSYNSWILRSDAANMTTDAGDILSSRTINNILQPDSCLQVNFRIAKENVINDSIYIAVNANRSRLGTDPNQIFPFNRVNECDYSNNLGKFSVSYWIDDNFVADDEIGVCSDEEAEIKGRNSLNYTWYFQNTVICEDCPEVKFKPDQSGWLYIENDEICGLDSVQLTVAPELIENLSITICEGDSLLFGQDYLKIAGNYQRVGTSTSSCDTTINLQLDVDRAINIDVNAAVCRGDSFEYRGQWYLPGSYSLTFPKSTGCDTTVELNIAEKAIPTISWTASVDCNDRGVVLLDLQPLDSILAVEVSSFMYLPGDEIIADTGSQILRVLFTNGCERSYPISYNAYPQVSTFVYPEICLGDANGSIRAEPAGFVSHIEWNGIEYNGNAINELPAGAYSIRVHDTVGCVTEVDLVVQPGTKPIADIDSVINVFYGQSRTLSLFTSGLDPLSIQWYPGDDLSCSDCPAPVFNGLSEREYEIMVIDSNGCMTETRTKIEINYQKKVFLPNAFTPNGDGVNDIFYPEIPAGINNVNRLDIYSRWGDLIFSMNSGGEGWDGTSRSGKLCDPGVYVYRCEVQFGDGSIQQFMGDVTLLR